MLLNFGKNFLPGLTDEVKWKEIISWEFDSVDIREGQTDEQSGYINQLNMMIVLEINSYFRCSYKNFIFQCFLER